MSSTFLQISALGRLVRVDLDDELTANDRARLQTVWSPAAGDPAAAPDVVLTAGVITPSAPRVLDVMGADYRSLASSLSTSVTLAAIELRKAQLLMLHACGVADDDGRVAVFVGPSGRGKTTLASRLGRTWSYVTDETVGIDANGTVYPYRKPLSVIEPGSTPSDHKVQVSAYEVGLKPLPSVALSAAAVVLMDRRSAHEGPPVVEAVRLIEAIVRLVPEMSYLPALDKPLQEVAALIERVGGAQQVIYRDADDLVPLLSGLIEPPSPRDGPMWEVVALAASAGRSDDGAELDTRMPRYRRIPPLDGLTADGVYAMIHADQVHVLDGIGPAIWDALAWEGTIDEVTSIVVAELGSPYGVDARALVAAALHLLEEQGIVEFGWPQTSGNVL